MLLYHYTLRRYLPSILESGLLCRKARHGRKAVWFVRSPQGAWACEHVLRKRMGGVSDICCIAVNVPRSWVKKGPHGLLYVEKDIPPERFGVITGFETTVISI